MNKQNGKWENKALVETFLEGVRGAIPGAKFQLEVLSKIVNMWFPQPSKILDLGCGDGIVGHMLLDAHATTQVTFADISEPMLAASKKKIGDNPRATHVKVDFATPGWVDGFEIEIPFDIIVSGFAIHHQPDERKKALYAEIYRLLGGGGMFLNLEHVSSATLSGSELFDSFFMDHIRRFHGDVSPDDKTIRKIEESFYRDKKDNILSPVEKQCQWLRDIGFLDVDCFFKVFELALFGGRKASNNPRMR